MKLTVTSGKDQTIDLMLRRGMKANIDRYRGESEPCKRYDSEDGFEKAGPDDADNYIKVKWPSTFILIF